MRRLIDLGSGKPWFGLGLVMALAVAVALALAQDRAAEAVWPADCQASTTVFWVECFNIGNNTVVDEANDANTVVTTQNGAWGDADAGADVCAIRDEELRLAGNATPAPCTTPSITLSGFASYTVSFLWGADVANAASMTADYSVDSGAFQSLATPGFLVDTNTCVSGANCATQQVSETLALGCGAESLLVRFTGTTVTDDDFYVDNLLVEGVGEACEPVPEDVTSLQIDKVFEGGPPSAVFTFTVGDASCQVDFDNDGFVDLVVLAGGTFTLTPADGPAYVYCDDVATITEEPGAGFTFDSITGCEAAFVAVEGATVTFTPATVSVPTTVVCTFNNLTGDGFVPALFVTKACVGDEADATYTIDLVPLEGQTDPAPIALECGGQDLFLPVEPGDYTLQELIDGPDAAEITTTIFCIGLPPVPAAQMTLTMVESSDQSCVFVNFFDPDADADADGDGIPDALEALICGCPIDIEIDIDNGNTNTIGIDNANTNDNANNNGNANTNDNDNENKNDNKNENTQNQDNTQDQNNTNDQTNNITSSPEVNIDFDD